MTDSSFEALLSQVRPQLARAFIAAYGVERGREALSEAMAYAWEERERLKVMQNPGGYLYRVGQSRTRPRKQAPRFPTPSTIGLPWVEPDLPAALRELSEHQRVCVVLTRAYEWTQKEVAELLGVEPTTVQNHVARGISRLRNRLGAEADDEA